MSGEVTIQRPKIRTYAADLEAQRNKQNPGSSSEKPVAEKAIPENGARQLSNSPTIANELSKIPQPASKKKAVEPVAKFVGEEKLTPSPIPSFHELQKRKFKDKTPVHENKKESSAKRGSRIKDKEATDKEVPRPNIGYDATVITDTVSDRFKLFPAIKASLGSWFRKVSAKKKKPTPKYSIPEANRRKGVIQRATTKTGLSFTADNETLKERIRNRKKEEERHDPETNWSPFTETGYELLPPGDTTQNVYVEFKKRSVPETLTTIPSPVQSTQPEPTIATEWVSEAQEEPQSLGVPDIERWGADREQDAEFATEEPVESSLPSPTVSEAPAIETVFEPVENNWEDETETEPVPPEPEPETMTEMIGEEENETIVTEEKPRSFLGRDTNSLTLTMLMVVIVILVIIFAGKLTVQHFKPEPATVEEVKTESIVKNAVVKNIIISPSELSQTKNTIRETLDSAPAGIIEFPLITPAGDELSPSYLFETLEFQTLPSLHQSITTIRFLSINQSEPMIILQFVDEDTVRGGFLNWEKSMVSDLKNLYEIPVVSEAKFSDQTVKNVDVRVLKNDDKVVLMYGMVSNNTAVISSKAEDFAQIVELGLLEQ
ncbi:hypothetical protein KC865_01105 [Candidatus Kaiserbacteria bacterium]|nr:hypothetical protein [Candidatus Kaiserbacteria bacterium]USN92544.1 MAG: hypothetical protein H6782_01880 [Candidatus Nomurabacteria bacterium]